MEGIRLGSIDFFGTAAPLRLNLLGESMTSGSGSLRVKEDAEVGIVDGGTRLNFDGEGLTKAADGFKGEGSPVENSASAGSLGSAASSTLSELSSPTPNRRPSFFRGRSGSSSLMSRAFDGDRGRCGDRGGGGLVKSR